MLQIEPALLFVYAISLSSFGLMVKTAGIAIQVAKHVLDQITMNVRLAQVYCTI